MHHDATVAQHRAHGRVSLVVERNIPLRRRHIRAQRPAHLHRLDRPAAGRAAAVVEQQLAQRHTEGHLDQPAVADVARQLHQQRAARAAGAVIAVMRRAARQDERHAGQRDHVVDHRGLAEQPLDGRQRRLGAHDAALAFQAFQHRRFFAAHIGARCLADVQVKRPPTAQHVGAQGTRRFGTAHRLAHRGHRVRVLGADVHIALRGPHRQRGDRHAFDQQVGVALHHHAVGVGAGIALVGVAHHVLLRSSGGAHRLPFQTGRKGRTTAPAQARLQHFVHHLGARHTERPAQPHIAAVRLVVGDGQRVGEAHAGKGQPLLSGKVRDLLGEPQAQRVRPALQRAGIEQAGHIVHRHRAIGHAAGRRGHLKQRLQPEQPPRTIAHQRQGQPARRGLVGQTAGHTVGPHRQRSRVARQVTRDGRRDGRGGCVHA